MAGGGHSAGAAEDVVACTPSDTVEFDPCRGIYVEGAGNLDYVTMRGRTVTGYAVADYSHHPIRVKQVLSSTTATGIYLFY